MKKAVCVLIKIDDGYLVVTRPNSTLVGLVGGKVDEGETELEAIVREVKEEVGLVLNPDLFESVYTAICLGDVDYLTTAFTYPDLGLADIKYIKPEAGLEYKLVSEDTLCSPEYSPFAQYNRALLDKVKRINLIGNISLQADLYARSDNSAMMFDNYKARYTEKLVELVVQECIQQCEAVALRHLPSETTYAAGQKYGALQCMEELKQQFNLI